MSFPVSKLVLSEAFRQLKETTTGFNDTFNTLAAGYSIPATMAIQFEPADGASKNFVVANLDVEDIIANHAPVFPFMTLFVGRSVNENKQKFHQFSGVVEIGMRVFLSWKGTKLDTWKFANLAACVEETFYTVFNREGAQEWDEAVVFNGDIEIVSSPVFRGSEFYAQVVSATLTFELDQRG